MVRIGIVGIGFMGKTHYGAAKSVRNGAVTAICTRDAKKLAGDWTGIQGNFGGAGGMEDLSAVKKYADVADLLADPHIDLVDICLPTALHKDVTIQAFNAGKHVLLEKPITVELSDADEMVAAADRSGKKFFVGQVLRLWPEFAYIKQVNDSGEYGKLIGANFKRIISEPTWGANWFSDLAKSGGPGIDLHIHDSDFVNYLLGMPDRVYSRGILAGERFGKYVTTHYIYDDRDLTITAQCGAIAMKGRPFEHGFDAYFEKATLQYNSTWGNPLCVVTSDGIVEPEMPSGDAFAQELQYAIDTILNDSEPELLSGQSARDSLALCWREIESIRTGTIVPV
ncbi:Gfo/Idh/MocA family oxidoreductase [Candidatus Poribacteria bacterium]|nr:Gfo/Idh/MocA family oxidoreductase [Candidatus Poribacteria bacterium]